MGDAKKAFFDKGKEIKAKVAEEQQDKIVTANKANTQLEKISANEELASMYRENADAGTKNISGALPYLKVHTAGKSSTNELPNGEEPNNGWFFYQPTKEQYKELEVHILTISEGFYAKGMEENKPKIFNQILAGVIVDENELKPFFMYFTGKKLQNLWNFGKEARPYTKNSKLPIPMFAMKVKLTTSKEPNSKGYSFIVNFEIIKDDNGYPILVSDPNVFKMLRASVTTAEDTITSLIEKKTAPVDEHEEQPEDLLKGTSTDVAEEPTEPGNQNVDPDDIPF